jgi:basic membrane protein A
VTRRRLLLWTALLGVLAAIAAGCGGSSGGGGSGSVRVAVVTDVGGLNDRGFNALANTGLRRAESELGIEGRVFISKSASDYVPNLSTAARDGYDLVVGNGFLMGDAMNAVAKRFPDVSFAVIDYPWDALVDKPENVLGLVFAEQQAGYLAGVAAATVSTTGSVSVVGGQAVPAVVAFLAGYEAGAKATKPGVTVRSAYSEDFVDQAKCKELALNQIAQGSDVVFAAAGGCGLGALQAAKDRGLWGIGVDNDQSFLGPHILTSATKKVDVAVYETIQKVRDGEFEGGRSTLFDLATGGVGYGKVSASAPNRETLIERLDEVSAQIASGDVTPPAS